jgi:hypothetical protein
VESAGIAGGTGRPISNFPVSHGSRVSYATIVSGWLKSWDRTIEPGLTYFCTFAITRSVCAASSASALWSQSLGSTCQYSEVIFAP